jgi:hypothetical protein
MRRLSLAILIAAAALAQAPAPAGASKEPPPPEVDQALRARVLQFYDLQVQGQYRKAEQLVAEDTKDFYYNLAKPQFLSAKLLGIEYSDSFTRAKAVVEVSRRIDAPPFPADVLLKGNVTSTWKIENGEWCWYDDRTAPLKTPFGTINPGPSGSFPPSTAGRTLPAPPMGFAPSGADGSLPDMTKAMNLLHDMVKADKPSVSLKLGGSGEIVLTNSAVGPMSVVVVMKPDGVTVKPMSLDLKANSTGSLTLEAGKDAKAGAIHIRVEQTGDIIPVRVDFP